MTPTLVGAGKAITSFAELRKRAAKLGPKRVGVVQADDYVALRAASDALMQGIAFPVLIGDEQRIRARVAELGLAELADRAEFVAAGENAAETAVRLAREGRIDLLMKGHLRTDELLHPVLNREKGLRTGRLLCDVAMFEYRGPDGPRLVGLSDGGLNVAPTLAQKKEIIKGGIKVLHRLGVAWPKVALLSAVEVVTGAMPSTVEAWQLTGMGAAGEFGKADVYGPLALDNALLEWAAQAKGISHPVAGHADFLLAPTIEAANLLAKAIIFIAGSEFAHVIVGATKPILIPSRVESAQDKVNAMALGVVYAAR